MISIIVAMGSNRVIGMNNGLIWHLPADLQHFKKTTLGKPVIMGRKTFESMGKPLPGRTNVVVTRKKNYNPPGCMVAGSIEEAIDLVKHEPEIFIAGGGEIYRQAIGIANRIYLTIVEENFEGDTYFPAFSENDFVLAESRKHVADEQNSYSMTFLTYNRK